MLESCTKIAEGNDTVSPLVSPPPFYNVYIHFKKGLSSSKHFLPWSFSLSTCMFICHIHTVPDCFYFTGHYCPLRLKVPLPSPITKLLTHHPLRIPPNMPTTHQSPTGVGGAGFLLLPSQRALGSSTAHESTGSWGLLYSSSTPPPPPLLASLWAGVQRKVPISAQRKQK